MRIARGAKICYSKNMAKQDNAGKGEFRGDKKFGEKDEAGFVNGVLGGFMKAYTAGEIKPSGVIGAQTAKEAHSGKDGEGEAQ